MSDFAEKFYQDFIVDDRWKFITEGLKVTLIVTLFSLLIGVAIGVIIGIVRCAYDQQDKTERRGLRGFIIGFLNFLAQIYVTVIRERRLLCSFLSCTSSFW